MKVFKGSAAVFLLAAGLACGCQTGSSTVGTKMDQQQVSKIVKGKTTRQEVEAMLGTPTQVMMQPEGKRAMMYHFSATDTSIKGASFIPIYGAFGGGAKATSQQQSLQINLDKNGIVEDYEFNDHTMNTDVNRFGNVRSTSAATQPATP